jgi:hypothetical protein
MSDPVTRSSCRTGTIVTPSRPDDIMALDGSSKIHMATHFYAAHHGTRIEASLSHDDPDPQTHASAPRSRPHWWMDSLRSRIVAGLVITDLQTRPGAFIRAARDRLRADRRLGAVALAASLIVIAVTRSTDGGPRGVVGAPPGASDAAPATSRHAGAPCAPPTRAAQELHGHVDGSPVMTVRPPPEPWERSPRPLVVPPPAQGSAIAGSLPSTHAEHLRAQGQSTAGG